MADSQKGIDPIAYMTYGENPQLRASAIARLQAIREDRMSAVAISQDAYRSTEKQLLDAISVWRQSEDSERSERALEVGRLQRTLAKLDKERRDTAYPQRFLQNIQKKPPIFLGNQIRVPVRERVIPV